MAGTGSCDGLARRISGCRICIEKPDGAPLPHAPRPVLQIHEQAKVLIAGQAPGTRVHASGRPFTDPSGDRLRDWMGVDEATFYDARKIAIVPMGFCFPGLDKNGGDIAPRRECAPAWRGKVMDVLGHIELVLVIGLYAQRWHLGGLRQKNLSETVRAWRGPLETLNPPVIALPHPSWRNNAWIKKNPWFETELLPVVKREIKRIVC